MAVLETSTHPEYQSEVPVSLRSALLGDQHHDLAFYAVDHEIREDRCRRIVPVPDIVVDCLKVPHALTGFRIQADYACRKQVVAMSMATVIIAGGSFCRQVNEPGFRVVRDLRPNGGIPRVRPESFSHVSTPSSPGSGIV